MIGSVFVLGPAGTGKSTFSGSMKDWMVQQGFDCCVVNLDPGAEYLPYEPEIDVRDMISLDEVMAEYNLGPNGAQIVAADLMLENVNLLQKALGDFEDYYVVFDTPGQIELFAFRTASPLLVDSLTEGKASISFISDAVLSSSPSGFISQKLLYASVISRFFKPSLHVINKTDLVTDADLAIIEEWETNHDRLMDAFVEEKQNIEKSYFTQVINAFREISLIDPLIPVSARDLTGFEEVYSRLSLHFQGGEDTDTAYKDD